MDVWKNVRTNVPKLRKNQSVKICRDVVSRVYVNNTECEKVLFLAASDQSKYLSRNPQIFLNIFPRKGKNGLLKLHKKENFLNLDFEFYTVSLLVMLKY
jgi:hypothetical protein